MNDCSIRVSYRNKFWWINIFAVKIYLLFREKMFMLCLFTGRLVKNLLCGPKRHIFHFEQVPFRLIQIKLALSVGSTTDF